MSLPADTVSSPMRPRRGVLRRALSLLASRKGETPGAGKKTVLQGMPTQELTRHLSLTLISGHPDRTALARMLKPAILDWKAHNWSALGERLANMDRRHSALPSGERVATALGQALFRQVIGPKASQMIDRGQSVTAEDLPDDVLAPLMRAITRPATDPTIHFLAAQFSLEAGWARRGEEDSELALEDALNAAQARFRAARNILHHIAPRAPHSAYFAEIDYRTLAAEGTTEDALTRAAIRWTRTDPTAFMPYAVHGLHLLPRWYGTQDTLPAFAKRSWSKTHETLGAGAYAACYLQAIEADRTALLSLDFVAFREGLVDMMQESDDPDLTCNAILRTLWEAGHPDAVTDRDTAALRKARRELRGVFTYLVRNTLGPVIPDVWGPTWTETRILHALAEAFEDDIARGARISVGLQGTVISAAV